MTAIVQIIEARQRELMTSLADQAVAPRELMTRLWEQVSSPELRPFVRLFFEVFAMAAQGVPGTQDMLTNLTDPWLSDGAAPPKGSACPPMSTPCASAWPCRAACCSTSSPGPIPSR
jgi:hypothetical protein